MTVNEAQPLLEELNTRVRRLGLRFLRMRNYKRATAHVGKPYESTPEAFFTLCNRSRKGSRPLDVKGDEQLCVNCLRWMETLNRQLARIT